MQLLENTVPQSLGVRWLVYRGFAGNDAEPRALPMRRQQRTTNRHAVAWAGNSLLFPKASLFVSLASITK